MNQSFNVQFYCRESKATNNGYAPLEVAINLNGVRKFINLPYKCLPSDFNRKKQPKELVDYMASMRKRINEILASIAASGEPLTAQTLKDYIRTGGYKSYTVENLFDDYFNIIEKRIGTTMTKSVYSKYQLVRDLFYTIINKETECTNIAPIHIRQFKAICESKYKTSTTGGYLQKLKTVLIFGMDNGKIKINPFIGVKIDKGTPDIQYLTQEELDYLHNLQVDNKALNNALQYFLFECYSGISYADIKQLSVNDIQVNNGVYFIRKKRQKTGKEFVSVLLPRARELFDNQGFKFRTVALQNINVYLHEIEKLYNFPKKITTHIGRHTYATLLVNKYRCSMEVTASALGDSLKVTQKHYAKFLPETTINEIGSKLRIAE